MTELIAAETEAAAALEADFEGTVIARGHPDYQAARRVWNGSIDRHPALVARCATEADVARALQVARRHGLLVAVRGGGHNIAGLGVCDRGMVIDLSAIRRVAVDADGRVAEAGGGCTWRDVDAATQAHGLATPGGVVSSTGIGGFTLGGGFGWLSRRFGLASDNLLSARMVTAGGDRVLASPEENPDLFWAIRGGGGNFGVVTSFRYRLHPVGPLVTSGLVVHPLEDAAGVLRALRGPLEELPDEAFVIAILRVAPPAPELPAEVRGRHVLMLALCHCGPLDDGERALRACRSLGRPLVDLVRPRPYAEWQAAFDASWTAGFQNYWKAEYVAGLSDGAVDALVEHAARISSPLSDIKLGVFGGGGAVGRVPAEETAVGHRLAPLILNINSRWSEGDEAGRHVDWTRSLWAAMQPFSFGGVYVNFLGDEGADRVRAAYGDATFERLRQVKAAWDPGNLLRVNQNIPPA